MGTVFEDVVFWVLAVASVAGALGVVLIRDVFRAALLLVVVFLAIAGIFVLLNAEFLAVVQVLIYAGAIAVLIIFAIMLTREVQQGNLPNRLQPAAVVFPALLLAVLVFVAVDTDWDLLASADDPIPQDAALQAQYTKDQALRRTVEMLQTNTVRGLPELWEEAVTDDLQAEVLDGTTPAAVAERQIAYLEQGRLVASLGSSFLPDFQAAEPAGEPLLISDRIRSELNGKFRELEQTAGEPQRSIDLSPDALIKGKLAGAKWRINDKDGDQTFTVLREDDGLDVYEGRFELADDRSGIGDLLINDFVLPFEVASVLLLAAMIGAFVLVRER